MEITRRITYYGKPSSNKPELRSHEIIAILLDEDRRSKGRLGNLPDSALQAKGKNPHGKRGKDSDKECYNCGGLYTPPRIPRGVRAESEDCLSCPRTKFGQILAEIPAKFENPSPNLVRGQS